MKEEKNVETLDKLVIDKTSLFFHLINVNNFICSCFYSLYNFLGVFAWSRFL